MTVGIYTIEKTLFEGEADGLVLPGIDGEMGILNNHAPLTAALSTGIIKLRQKQGDKFFEIKSGVVQVLPDSNTIVLAN
jgi:F-type H+-transporting ATPase subunit epsilon